MKLITLNIWGGIVREPLLTFIKNHSDQTDIFCFQEVLFGDRPGFTENHKARMNIFNEISEILADFVPYKRITNSNYFQDQLIDFGAGQAIFVRKNIAVKGQGGLYCYEVLPVNTDRGGKLTGSLMWLDIEAEGEKFTIANIHGLWQRGVGKGDTPERLIQSEKVKTFLETKENKKILCGDFNLIPDGKSITLLEEGMANLVKKYNIQTTRSRFYDRAEIGGKFADYILTSEDIKVQDFKVFPDEVSDHLALFVEFN